MKYQILENYIAEIEALAKHHRSEADKDKIKADCFEAAAIRMRNGLQAQKNHDTATDQLSVGATL